MSAAPIAPILIVGGGPVGLAAALELARLNLRSILLEQRASTAWHPRTRNLNTRTMEIARSWSRAVYERLRAIDTPPGWKSPVRFLRTATGEEYGTIETLGFAGPGPDVSPALPVWSSQDLMERILLDGAAASGQAEVRFGQRARRLIRGGSDDDIDVVVEVENAATGAVTMLNGAALIAADGAESAIRNQLGIALEGPRNLRHFINVYFRSAIEPQLGERKAAVFFISNGATGGVLQPLDARGRWLCQITVPAEEWDTALFTPERCRDWIRRAVGVENIEAEILSVGKWRMNATVAARLQQGRIVLAGDAAHQFPPTGGLGVNTGLQGLHNVAWKLALFVQGRAGRGLLTSYDVERRPVARWSADQSLHNSQQVRRIGAAAQGHGPSGLSTTEVLEATRRYGNHLGVEFGTVYDSQAVVPDGTAPPEVADTFSDYVPSARPGCRAPHFWLGNAAADFSVLDLFGPGFTLLTGAAGGGWHQAALKVAKEFDLTVACYTIGDIGLEDCNGLFLQRYGISADGAVLVRPDGWVAWRGHDSNIAQAAALRTALARILA
jgi:putative polyketide hydroxylase